MIGKETSTTESTTIGSLPQQLARQTHCFLLYAFLLPSLILAISFQVDGFYTQKLFGISQETSVKKGACVKTNQTGLSIGSDDPNYVDSNLTSSRGPPNLTDSLLDRFIVVPEYKILFCYSEKVGCTMFNQLFRDLRLLNPSISREEAKWLARSHWFRNKPQHHNLTKQDLEGLLASPKWTKAVFYRDPVSRFVSAFRSKCGRADGDGDEHCQDAFGQKRIPFSDALDFLETADSISNPHFMPISEFCGGIKNNLEYYDFVQELNPKTVGSHIRSLFDKVHVPEETTELLIENVVETGGARRSRPIRKKVRKLWGLHVLRGGAKRGHNTHAKQYLDQENLDLSPLHRFYSSDYELFQQPINACVSNSTKQS